MAWFVLGCAIAVEVVGTMALKASSESHRPSWLLLTVLAYVSSFALLVRVLSMGIPVGVAYAVWAGVGIALVAICSHFLFHEPMSPSMMIGIVVIAIGVVLVERG